MSSLKNAAKKQHANPGPSERAAISEFVRAARARGEDITGPDGLLKYLTKTVLETALDEEMNEHLGYDKHSIEGNNTGNSRNGTRRKTVLTDNVGPVEIEVPRDRNGSFEPVVVKKRQRRLGDVDTVAGVALCQGIDHRGDLRALRRGLRRVTVQGPYQCHHRPGDRGDERLDFAPTVADLRRDLH